MTDDPTEIAHRRRLVMHDTLDKATCPHTGAQVGDRIRLTRMENDPAPIAIGAEGVVDRVEEKHSWGTTNPGQIGVKWDNGRTLMLVVADTPVPDTFDIIKRAGD